MFPVKCKDLLPLDHLLIKSVAVRGRLGPLTVWVSKADAAIGENGEYRFRLTPKYWTKLYEKAHPASRREYRQLELDTPIRLEPGQVKAIYIHSTLPGDEAIVYDNSYEGMSAKRYEDEKLAILTGRSHVSSQVFGQDPIWGWGNAWRDRREFVGRLEYGTVYKLWNPQVQPKFGSHFQDSARSLFLCQRRWESECSMLPDECIFYILNMCRWDWFNDTPDNMRARRKREKSRMKLLAQAQAVASHQNTELATAEASMEQTQRPCGGCKSSGLDDDHEMTDDAGEEADDDDDDDCDDDDDVGDDDDDDEEVWLEEDDELQSDQGSDDEDQYHRANNQAFTYRDVDSDASDDEDEQDEGEDQEATSRRAWIRRQFARIHVLRALASMEDGAVAHAQF
jgi:hypothetical protein